MSRNHFSFIFFSLNLIILPFIYGQKFAIIGDFRDATTGTYEVSELIKSWDPEFIVTVGDNYNPYAGTIDEQVGQYYHEFIYPYYGAYGEGDTVNRFFPAIGNHDVDGVGYEDYLDYFVLPGNERYYDFVRGEIHFFVLNSNPDEPNGTSDTSLQAQWLEIKLATSVSAYKIVILHHPPYSSGYHGSNTYTQWPFGQWGATTVISGHDHYYERLNIDDLPYFINGAGGGPLYTVFNAIQGSEVNYYDSHGAMLIEADSDSLHLRFYNVADSLIDKYTILNNQTYGDNRIDKDRAVRLNIIPNPFGHSAAIKFRLPQSGKVRLMICDVRGRPVAVPVDGMLDKGLHTILWNAEGLEAGIYHFCLYFDDAVCIQKSVLCK
ncbi:MAG: metallophosphoesterase [Bacteroidetes bacterium]|nr:metallophosphoesterase [Bacteroidota bacterium]